MKAQEIAAILFQLDASLESEVQWHNVEVQPILVVPVTKLIQVATTLKNTEGLYFDQLSCVTGVDNGEKAGTLEVIYHLNSIPYQQTFAFKVVISREIENSLPQVPSLVSVWRTADWQEREVFDMYGVHFDGHPDLRRILLPNDWEGYPLRKDYKEQEYYHGIKVAY